MYFDEQTYMQESALMQDFEQMKSMLPKRAARVQAYVEDACDRMEYEGSPMYDEVPDRRMIEKNVEMISMEILNREGELFSRDSLGDVVQLLLCRELCRRRGKRRRCPGFCRK